MLQGRPIKILGGPPQAIAISADLRARIANLLAESCERSARSHLVRRIDPALLAPGR